MRLDLGIDIGGTNVKAALVSEEGTVAAFALRPWSGGPPGDAVAAALALREELAPRPRPPRRRASAAPAARASLTARGASSACPRISRRGTTSNSRGCSPRLWAWRRSWRTTRTPPPAGSTPSARRGARRTRPCITLGTGVGGGLILGGRLYRGSHGFAGEVGHATIDLDGPPCVCGGAGCFERMVNAEAIVARARSSRRPRAVAARRGAQGRVAHREGRRRRRRARRRRRLQGDRGNRPPARSGACEPR